MNTTQGHTINSVQRTDTKLHVTDDQQDIVVRQVKAANQTSGLSSLFV